jgi:hypothetical protein
MLAINTSLVILPGASPCFMAEEYRKPMAHPGWIRWLKGQSQSFMALMTSSSEVRQ